MTTSLSIWQPVHLGTRETGRPVHVEVAERNLLVGGEPGAGKSVALNLIVGHAALSPDCRLVLVDGKRVELGATAGRHADTAPPTSTQPPGASAG